MQYYLVKSTPNFLAVASMDPILLTVLIHLGGKTKSDSSSKSIRLEALLTRWTFSMRL